MTRTRATAPEIPALPPEHDQLWRLAAPLVWSRLHQLLETQVAPNTIIVVVAHPWSCVGEAMRQRPQRLCTLPAVAVFVEDLTQHPRGFHGSVLRYMERMAPEHVCLLVVDKHNKPVLTTVAAPALAEGDRS